MSCVFIISAPAGSGKSTLVSRLLERDPRLIFSISCTTRAPRGKEQNGQQYYFLTREEFERRRDAGEFLEWAEVFGHYYGTHKSVLERGRAEGKDVVLDIDVQGARQLKERIPDATSIFILAPSREELERRLRARAEDAEQVIERRLAGAAREIENFERYDYIVINDDVERASEDLRRIVEATRTGLIDERVRALKPANGPVKARVEAILASFAQK
jgi:guanylate kinase